MIDGIRDDVNCDYDVAQLVFGKASNLPSTIDDHLPALDSTIRSVDLAPDISAIHAVRKAFLTSEALEKIK